MASVAVLLLLYSDCLKAEPLAGHLPAFRRLQLEPTPPNLLFPGETSDLASSQCLGFPRCSVRVPRVEPQKSHSPGSHGTVESGAELHHCGAKQPILLWIRGGWGWPLGSAQVREFAYSEVRGGATRPSSFMTI